MKYFYMDNFRGFSDALIPLSDVNFCVGENSTGKTSFLTLVHLFSTPRFWFEQLFETGESGFGHFDDIVSINSKDKRYFRVGFAEAAQQSAQNEYSGVAGYLFSFRREEGMPRLYKLTCTLGRHEIVILYAKNSVRYKIRKRESEPDITDFGKKIFKEWAAEHADSSLSGFQVLNTDFEISSTSTPLFAIGMIDNLIQGSKGRKFFGVPRPSFGGDMAWIAPIRTKPRRTYDEIRLDFSPEGEHTPYVVKKILDKKSSAQEFSKFVRKFGKESGLFTDVKVHRFGNSVTSPFELDIILDAKPLNISSVGYGVSQALPVAVELFVRPPDSWFTIQQPEVHLHPRAQAAFGEMVLELCRSEKKRFLIETHSDFTIDRYRIAHRQSDVKPSAQILFFERKAGCNVPTSIPILEDGELDNDQPDAYREFFFNEELRVLGVK